jgi:type I restriction enzyme M protein
MLPKDYARPALDKPRLSQLIDLISNITVSDAERRAQDVLGRG